MLNQIRMAAVEAYYSVPRGGVEIGGVLYGSMEPGRVIIRTFRRMECEHASGPSFALSERDLESLERLLREGETDPSLEGQQRVGWFHSHTRSELCLTEGDLDIYHGFFPGALEVALVLRPLHLNPTRAGFFFRDEAGEIRADASYREFITDTAYLDSFTTDEPLPAALSEPVTDAADHVALPHFARITQNGPEPVAAPTIRSLSRWIGAAVVAATLASGAVIALWRPRPVVSSAAAPVAGIDFEAVELDGQSVLRWNRQAPAVQNAAGGTLEIRDGDQQKQIAMQPDDVRRGLALYRRTSPRAEFRLKLWQAGQPAQEQLQTIEGATPEPPAPAPAPVKTRGKQRRRR